MREYKVELTAMATVSCTMTVQAESEDHAEKLAIAEAKAGEAEWSYDGVDDETIEVGITR